jgi:hypothetical protein
MRCSKAVNQIADDFSGTTAGAASAKSFASIRNVVGALLPESVSSFAGETDFVFRLILYVVGFFFVVNELLLVYFAVHYRPSRANRAVYSRGEKETEIAYISRSKSREWEQYRAGSCAR